SSSGGGEAGTNMAKLLLGFGRREKFVLGAKGGFSARTFGQVIDATKWLVFSRPHHSISEPSEAGTTAFWGPLAAQRLEFLQAPEGAQGHLLIAPRPMLGNLGPSRRP